MKCNRIGILAALGVVALSVPIALAGDEAKITAIKAKRILPISGDAVENGVILVSGGKITAIGAGIDIPSDATVIDLKDATITPGLIDANCTVGFELNVGTGAQYYNDTAKNSVDRAPHEAPAARKSLWIDLCERAEDEELAHHALHADAEDPCDQVCAATCGGGAWLKHQQDLDASEVNSIYFSWSEESSEVVPHYNVIDSVNLYSTDFKRLLRGGVTTIFVAPDSACVIGQRGAIVKTAGPLKDRIVRRADAVKATMGQDPASRGHRNDLPPAYGRTVDFHTRRPTTRMGVEWVYRKAFHDADRMSRGIETHGADAPPAAAVPMLQKIRSGEIPLRIQARVQHDIFEALRLSNEFHTPFILEEATEAYQCIPELKAAHVPVIYGPIMMTPAGYRARSGEAREPRLNTPKQLHDAGISFALSAQERRDEEGLVRQAMFAAHYGLPADEALKSITQTPAQLLNLDEVGTLKLGGAADIVAWSDQPLSATARVTWAMVNGQVVLEAD